MSPSPENYLRVGEPVASQQGLTVAHTYTAGDGEPPNRQEVVRLWLPDGIFLSRSDECRYDPPVMLVPIEPRVGASWRATSRCDGDHWTLTFEVLRFETIPVGSRDVPCVVVQRTDRAPEVPGQVRRVHWWALKSGLIAQQDRYEEHGGGVVRARLHLRSTEPEA